METKTFEIKFKGVDNFNRPVYKIVDQNIYYGSTEKLFFYDATESTVNDYFKNRTNELEFFGNKFNCEPIGGRNENIILKIV